MKSEQSYIQAQEQAIQRERLDLEKRMDRKIDDLRGFVFSMGKITLDHREKTKRETGILRHMVDDLDRLLQELNPRLVRCYALAH